MAYTNKTHATGEDPVAFLNTIEDPVKRDDSFRLLALMEKVTGKPPVMWGNSLIGFGSYRYQYDSGHKGEYLVIGFSPRKANLSIYILPGFDDYRALMKKLGTYMTGRSCLNVKKLADIDETVLEQLIGTAYQDMLQKYTCS